MTVYDLPCPKCGSQIVSTARMLDDTKAPTNCANGHTFMRAEAFKKQATSEYYEAMKDLTGPRPIQIQASQRLAAATIVKDGYTEAAGAKELARLNDYYQQHPQNCTPLGVKGALHFYKFSGGRPGADIVCMVNDQAVGTVHLTLRNIELTTGAGSKSEDIRCVEPSSYISKEYRGKGIMLGMYQWIISKYNLISDNRQSRDSYKLWQRLSHIYPTQIITQTHPHARQYRLDPSAKTTLKTTLMLIRSHA